MVTGSNLAVGRRPHGGDHPGAQGLPALLHAPAGGRARGRAGRGLRAQLSAAPREQHLFQATIIFPEASSFFSGPWGVMVSSQ